MMVEKISLFTELPSVRNVVKRWFPETVLGEDAGGYKQPCKTSECVKVYSFL